MMVSYVRLKIVSPKPNPEFPEKPEKEDHIKLYGAVPP